MNKREELLWAAWEWAVTHSQWVVQPFPGVPDYAWKPLANVYEYRLRKFYSQR